MATQSPSATMSAIHVANTASMPQDVAAKGSATKTRRAIVLYGSRYGNTKKVARALARGLIDVPGVEVDCVSLEEVSTATIASYDLVAVGGPTEWRTASAPVKQFFSALKGVNLTGHKGFAFDTRYRYALAGSAAKVIQEQLEKLGATLIRPNASAFVSAARAPEQETLLDTGSEEQFEQIGKELGSLLLA